MSRSNKSRTPQLYQTPENVAVSVSSLNLPLLHVLHGELSDLEKFVTDTGADGMEYTFTRRSAFAHQLANVEKNGLRSDVITSGHAGWGAKGPGQLLAGNRPDSRLLSTVASTFLDHRGSFTQADQLAKLAGRPLPLVAYANNEHIYGDYGNTDFKKLLASGTVSEITFQLKPHMDLHLPEVKDAKKTASQIQAQAEYAGFKGLCADVHHLRCWMAEQRISPDDDEYLGEMLYTFASRGFIKEIHHGWERSLDNGETLGHPDTGRSAKEDMHKQKTLALNGKFSETFAGIGLKKIHYGLAELERVKGEPKNSRHMPTVVIEMPAGISDSIETVTENNRAMVSATKEALRDIGRPSRPLTP